MTLSRRKLLKSGAAASVLSILGSLNPIAEAAAGEIRAHSLSDILSMSPADAAQESKAVQAAMDVINNAAASIQDAKVRAVVLESIRNPAPTIAGADKESVTKALKAKGYIPESRESAYPVCESTTNAPQAFSSAPGSGYASHHAYPGGLATHVALNTLSIQDLLKNYNGVFDCALDADTAVAAELLHDLHKPWVFQWNKDNSSRREEPCAGTGEHHVLSIAESMKRGLPAKLVVAQACAHDHPGNPKSEASVVKWLDAASIFAGVDPVKAGYLAADKKTLPLPRGMEGFAVHLADHDFVLSAPACKWSVEALRQLAAQQYGIQNEKEFNAFRNYVLAQLTAMRLYAILSSQGKEAFAAEVARAVRN